jgi:hypothetical protein
VSGAVDRAARRLLHLRVLSAFLLCALILWFTDMAGTYRMPNPQLALSILVGAALLALTALLLARRVASATPSEVSGHVLEIIERYAPLLVLNLMVLTILAPFLGLLATVLVNMSVLKVWLTLLGWLSGQALFWLFALSISGLLAVAGMRLLDRAVRRWPAVARAASVMDRGIILAAALYCAWSMLLTFNGTFDSAPPSEHRSEIVKVWGIGQTSMWWADVRSWESPRGIKRILIFPERDRVVPALLSEGRRVLVRVRPGLFRLPWVESMRLDYEHELDPLVAAAPSASMPRKWLIETLLRDGRWGEAAQQTQTYARYHPDDRDFVKRVATALRAARQTTPASELDRMAVLPVSQPWGRR